MEQQDIYQAKLHWIIFIGPAVLALLGIGLGCYFTSLIYVALMLCGIAVIWAAMNWVMYHFSALTIRKKQVILQSGILVRQTIDIPMNKIESIDIKQTLLGSIFKYGTLIVTGTGGTRHGMHTLSHPLTCRRIIEQCLHQPHHE